MTDDRTRARRARRARDIEGIPDDACLYESGYDSDDCDCDVCDSARGTTD